jgi:hypothetical protein
MYLRFFSHSEGRLTTTTPTTAPSSPSLTSFPSFAPVNVRKSKRNRKRKSNRKYKQRRGSSRGNYNHGEISIDNDANGDNDDDNYDDANSKSLAAVKDDIVVKANDTIDGDGDDYDFDTCDDHNVESQLITVVFRQDVSSQMKSPTTQSSIEIMKLSTIITLQKALEMLCSRLNTTLDEIQELEIKYPLPRKLIRLSTTNITHSTSQELQRYMMILISMIIPSSLTFLSTIVCL